MAADHKAGTRCPACGEGPMRLTTFTRTFTPGDEVIEVLLETCVCDACEAHVTQAGQHRENLRRLAARKARYGARLMGEEILALRKHYGLTQQQASRIFGKGKIAFSRYESETSYPDASTTLLLRLAAEQPAAMKRLADLAGIELPLWSERSKPAPRPR